MNYLIRLRFDSSLIGFANFRLGNFEDCIADLAHALEVSNQRDTPQFAEETYLAFGHLYYAIDSMELAIKSYHQSIALAKTKSDTSSIIPAYDGLGNTYQDLEVYDSAKYYFEQNLQMVGDADLLSLQCLC